jgi:uncharacterized repeat protein (TIGR01451 family)
MKKFEIKSLHLAIGAVVILPMLLLSTAIASNISSTNTLAQDQKVVQKQQPVELLLSAEKRQVIRDESGAEKISWNSLPSNSQVIPGSVLRYVVTAKNNTSRNMRNLSVTQPIPDGMVYVLPSATSLNTSDSKLEFSIDSGKTFSTKPIIRVRNRDGKIEERPAPADAYTHVRWNFGETLQANSNVMVSYQVRVK